MIRSMLQFRHLFFLGAILPALSLQAATIVLEGHYQGKNIFVQNPFSEAGVGFCVYQVTVNDKVSTDELNSSAFEVDLGVYNLKIGDKVTVKILHKDGCSPLVLNPEVLKPKSTFNIVKQGIAADGTYSWTTTNETGELPFVVQQKRWNKWVRVGEVPGIGTTGEHTYTFKVVPHSGENTFRVAQTDLTKRPRVSESMTFTDPGVAAVTWSYDKAKKAIHLSSSSLYEIYDQYGNIVKRGYAAEVDVAALDKGLYYLNFDNKMGDSFTKR
ncbi:MAG: hypothetical protein KBH07_06720 [Flavobacteriales bacterium]|nr:hypothetical protein [Flavobacteriales bacterium]MBP9079835.1 hypothetical protein [Flavobacteriales bacterium]